MKIRTITGLAAALAAVVCLLAGCSALQAGGAADAAPTEPAQTTTTTRTTTTTVPTTTTTTAPPLPGVEFAGHHYEIYSSDGASWDEIVAECEAQGGYLASINSEEENLFLFELAQEKGQEAVLFGLYLDKSVRKWKWVSEEPVDYTCWRKGEPNNSNGIEYYGMYYPGNKNGQWNDGDRRDFKAYICEWD